MLDAAPFQHGFQSVPLPRVDRQPVLHLHRQHAPGEPTLVVLRLPFGRVLGDLLVALQPPGRQRQVIQLAREAAARQPPPRSRRRVLSCQQPAGTVRPCSAAGGLFEAERRHRRWSRSRSVLPPAAPSTLRRKARSYSRSYQRLAGTLHLASRCEATDPVHHSPARITCAAGRVALIAAFTTARCARLRSRSALRRCSRLRSGCASRSRRFLSR